MLIMSVTTCWVRVAVGVNTGLAGAEAVGGGRPHAGVGLGLIVSTWHTFRDNFWDFEKCET